MVKLLVDAARQTNVDGRIVPWATIPIELAGVDAPLPVFESDADEALEVAEWYVAKQNRQHDGELKTPLGPAEVRAVAQAVQDALAKPSAAQAAEPAQRPTPPPPPPPPPPPAPPAVPELLFVLPVSDGTHEHELEVHAGDVPRELAQQFVTLHDLSHITEDAVSQIEAAIVAEHQRLATLGRGDGDVGEASTAI